jgi:hypothetical protein
VSSVLPHVAGQGVALRSADVGVTGRFVATLRLKGYSSSYWCDPLAGAASHRIGFHCVSRLVPADFTSGTVTERQNTSLPGFEILSSV